MFGQFDAPHPIDDLDMLDTNRNDASEFLADFFRQLDLPDSQDMHGYGLHLNVETDGIHLISHPFCWCDGETCPYCACTFNLEDIGCSRHTLIEDIEPAWKTVGFVEGHGAPNLWLKGDGFDIRMWWYKYIGRAMEVMLSDGLDWQKAEDILTVFAKKAAPLTQKHRKAERIALLAKPANNDYRGLENALLDEAMLPHLDTLLCTLESARSDQAELSKIQNLLTKRTKLPAQKRDGTALSPSWRLKKTLDDPNRNIK